MSEGRVAKGRAFVLHAHPCRDSYNAALFERTTKALERGGWEVDRCDLYAEEFDPVMSEADRREYHDLSINRSRVAPYVDRLLAARALVLVFPVWNYGFPAIMKGFFDRVFLPGVSFTLDGADTGAGADRGRLTGALANIERLAAVTTYGGDRWRTFLAGDPPRKFVTRAVRATVATSARTRYLALHDMNNVGDGGRAAFLDKVEKRMEAL